MRGMRSCRPVGVQRWRPPPRRRIRRRGPPPLGRRATPASRRGSTRMTRWESRIIAVRRGCVLRAREHCSHETIAPAVEIARGRGAARGVQRRRDLADGLDQRDRDRGHFERRFRARALDADKDPAASRRAYERGAQRVVEPAGSKRGVAGVPLSSVSRLRVRPRRCGRGPIRRGSDRQGQTGLRQAARTVEMRESPLTRNIPVRLGPSANPPPPLFTPLVAPPDALPHGEIGGVATRKRKPLDK